MILMPQMKPKTFQMMIPNRIKFIENVISPCLERIKAMTSLDNALLFADILLDDRINDTFFWMFSTRFNYWHIADLIEERWLQNFNMIFFDYTLAFIMKTLGLRELNTKNILDFALVNTKTENIHRDNNSQLQREDFEYGSGFTTDESQELGNVTYGNKLSAIKNIIVNGLKIDYIRILREFDSLFSRLIECDEIGWKD